MQNRNHNQDNAEPRFSLWQPGITTQRPPYIAEATLKQAAGWMRTERLRQLTLQLRAITDPKQQAAFKRDHLPYATFGGTFTHRQQDALLKPSHLICLDFDHIADPRERSHTRQLLLQDPFLPTLLLFTSPRGEGIKWITKADPAQADHATWYRAILRYLEQQYQLQPDHAPSNVASACFLCHDPELIFPDETPRLREQQAEKDPAIFPLRQYAAPHKPQRPTAPAPHSQAATGDTLADVLRATEQIERRQADITQGYDRWLRLALALADGLGEQGRDPFHRLSAISPQYTARETDRLYDDCLKRHNGAVSIATFFHLAQEAGIDCASHTDTKSATSATSATSPFGENIQKQPKKAFLPTFDTEWRSGGMAEVAESGPDGGTSGYTFSDKIPEGQLPEFLLPVLQLHPAPADRDKQLLATLNIISGLVGGASHTADTAQQRSGIYGIYDGRRVYAPLYNIVYGTAGSSKGEMAFAKLLAQPVKQQMRARYEARKAEYDRQLAEYEAHSRSRKATPAQKPQEPPYQDPFVPGNSTSSAVYRALDANGGWGMMFETEADTVSAMLQSDYGNYSDLMRKAHHHEPLSMNRVTDRLHVDIEEPRLSVFLTCTPGQLPALFPDFENGLGSRMLFYALPTTQATFHDVFARTDTPIEDTYRQLGQQLLPLLQELSDRQGNPLQFVMSQEQQQEFLTTFRATLGEQLGQLGPGITASVYRLALQAFRYAMTLTLIRRLSEWQALGNEEKARGIFHEDESALLCDSRDFRTALAITEALVNHTARVYAVLAKEGADPFQLPVQLKPKERKVWDRLPAFHFKTADFMAAAAAEGIPSRTADRMLSLFKNRYAILIPVKHGVYRKATPAIPQEE